MKEKYFSRTAKHFFYILVSTGLFLHIGLPTLLAGDSETKNSTSKTSIQNIGGLLFDVDEGVKVEQGAGGSVYVKSNREYMREKFTMIEQSLSDLDSRISKLEAENNPPSENISTESGKDSKKRRVLST